MKPNLGRFFGFAGTVTTLLILSGGAGRSLSEGETRSTSEVVEEIIPVSTYRVVRSYPHDRRAFTQGLLFTDGVLYESTGGSAWSPAILGQSSVRKVDLATGRILAMRLLRPEYFGEGIAVWGDRIAQLTWRSQIGFIYDKADLQVSGSFAYRDEGWGITCDGKRLIMSDGTPVLRLWDPDTFMETGRLEVKAMGRPVTWLNELEYVKGEIFANVWQSDRIARIAPDTGEVTGWIDLAGLLSVLERGPTVDVLNGIAYDSEGDRLFVTGKGWPKLFEIELLPAN